MELFAKIKKLFKKDKKKLGLALGSGGARGMALIGVIKAFEEEDIHFDIISGCSIGSIIGGMYAAGYTATQMLGFLREYYLYDLKRIVIMKIKGYTVQKLLDNMLGGVKFEELKLPFTAIATDLYEGETVVMDSGEVSSAMAASSAIPPVFKPVERDGRKLIDGALMNSLPADVVKKRGADFVVSVSITEEPTNNKSKDTIDQLYRENKIPRMDRLKKGIEASDFVLEPDMSSYGFANIGQMDDMYMEGYNYAKKRMSELVELLTKNGFIKKKK